MLACRRPRLFLAARVPTFSQNILLVYLVTGTDLALTALTNVLLPMVADKLDYASFRTLILYNGYAGFLHLGLLNGLYLSVVGRSEDELDWATVGAVRGLLYAVQAITLPLGLLVLLLVLRTSADIPILVALGVSWGAANVVTFHNYFLQGTNQFRPFAVVSLCGRATAIAAMLYLILGHVARSVPLAVGFVVPLVVTAFLYEWLWHSRATRSGRARASVRALQAVYPLWQRGVTLFLANASLSLVFTVGTLFANLSLAPSEFATFAFAYGLTTVSSFVLDGLAAALTPQIARSYRDTLEASSSTYTAQLVVAWLLPLGYWPFAWLVPLIFPKYADALPLLAFFCAALPFTSLVRARIVSVATGLGMEGTLFRVALVGLVVTGLSVLISHGLFRSTSSIALGWLVGVVLMGAIGGLLVAQRLRGPWAWQQLRMTANAALASLAFGVCAASGSGPIACGAFVVIALAALAVTRRQISRVNAWR